MGTLPIQAAAEEMFHLLVSFNVQLLVQCRHAVLTDRGFVRQGVSCSILLYLVCSGRDQEQVALLTKLKVTDSWKLDYEKSSSLCLPGKPEERR